MANVLLGGEHGDFHPGVLQQDAERFRSRIPGCPQDGDARFRRARRGGYARQGLTF